MTLGSRFSAVTVVLATVVLLGGSVAAAAPAQDPQTKRSETQRRRKDVGRQIDALNATDDELKGALGDIDARLNAVRDSLTAAETRLTQLQADSAAADDAAHAAEAEVERTSVQVREVAVDAFINPPESGVAAIVSAETLTDALAASSMLRARADHRADVLAAQRRALDEAETRRTAADAAAGAATAERDELVAQVASLDSERRERAKVVAEADRRLEAALAESASLQRQDAALASEIAANQAALLAVATKPAPSTPKVKVPPPTRSTPVAAPSPNPGQSPTPGPSPSPPPAPSPPPVIPTPTLRTVGGITVASSIADQVAALLSAAAGAGLNLSGWGFRDPQAQIDLRRAHCGPTDYDIYQRPASQCSPPTARPGQSNHEKGLAIDFTCNGATITSRSSPCFVWLAGNAGGFGLFNLPSEPWHWSVNGG